ncbi:23S rRNA (guanosine(2251)-2'-O)-methyltransferase RlmB [Tepidimonas sp.]|uniref:23S rRNA (guanosine(2251)-2'-O)-methyltransferase RlmB n=1 Tax=Tepidimonas sp. TaxID=2002775 RepID=UPI002FDFCA3F
MVSDTAVLFGFHAIGVRLKLDPGSILELYADPARRDARMRQFLQRAQAAGVRVIEADGQRLARLAGGHHHQGVVARVRPLQLGRTLDDVLDQLDARCEAERRADPPLLLVLDGVTDPHNLGACLRVADGAGAHAVIAPKDQACALNATVAKVASGAADTVPYLMVTNLARTLDALKVRGIWVVGTSDDAPRSLYEQDWRGPVAIVLGAEGKGIRPLVRRHCDELVAIPMRGAVESLNVSVASAVCLYEAVRQRLSLGAPRSA